MLFSCVTANDVVQLEVRGVREDVSEGDVEAVFGFPEHSSQVRIRGNDTPIPPPDQDLSAPFLPDATREFFRLSFMIPDPSTTMSPILAARYLFLRRSTFLKSFGGYSSGDAIPFSVWSQQSIITEVEETYNQFECSLQAGRYASVKDDEFHVWEFVRPRAAFWTREDVEKEDIAGSSDELKPPVPQAPSTNPFARSTPSKWPPTTFRDASSISPSNQTYHTASCTLESLGITHSDQIHLNGILVDDERIIIVKVPPSTASYDLRHLFDFFLTVLPLRMTLSGVARLILSC